MGPERVVLEAVLVSQADAARHAHSLSAVPRAMVRNALRVFQPLAAAGLGAELTWWGETQGERAAGEVRRK